MRVLLAKQWFGPDGARYRAGERELPNSWRDKLPKTAKVLSEVEVAPAEEPAKAVKAK